MFLLFPFNYLFIINHKFNLMLMTSFNYQNLIII